VRLVVELQSPAMMPFADERVHPVRRLHPAVTLGNDARSSGAVEHEARVDALPDACVFIDDRGGWPVEQLDTPHQGGAVDIGTRSR
jgi:hypothetical protein